MNRVCTTADRLKQYLGEKDIRPIDLSDAITKKAEDYGVKFSKSHMSLYMNGKAEPSQDKILVMSEVMGVSPAWLMGVDVPEYQPKNAHQVTTIPVAGIIACGTPIEAVQTMDDSITITTSTRADFALLCSGDSMEPNIRSGDYVLIRSQPDVEDGQTAAVQIEGEATLKRVYHQPEGLMLVADNPKYRPIIAIRKEVTIIGKAVGIQRMFE